MTVYQTCPFCDHGFEIGPADYRPMEHHILLAHTKQREVQATKTV